MKAGAWARGRAFPFTCMELERNAWRFKEKPSWIIPCLIGFGCRLSKRRITYQGSWNILSSYGFYIEWSGEIALPRLCGAASHHTVRRWTLSLSAPDNSFVRETTFVFSLWGLIGRLWDCWVDELWGCFDCWMKCLTLLFRCRLFRRLSSVRAIEALLIACCPNTTCISLRYLCWCLVYCLKVWGVWWR